MNGDIFGMNAWLLASLVAFLVISAAVAAMAQRRQQQLSILSRQLKQLDARLQELDEALPEILTAGVGQWLRDRMLSYRDLLAEQARAAGGKSLDIPYEWRTGGVIPRPRTSTTALKRSVMIIKRSGGLLQELVRARILKNTERVKAAEALARAAVLLQVESLRHWARMPSIDRVSAVGNLREAQQLLMQASHLDSAFTQRITEIKSDLDHLQESFNESEAAK